MEDNLKMTVSKWETTVSIWSSWILIWDILSLWRFAAPYAAQPASVHFFG